jgi:N-acetyl-gamma-glutamyl-phosphate reductase
MDRGIIATMYGRLKKPATDVQLIAAAREFYAGKPFIRVVEHLPTTKDSAHTNFCDITIRTARGQAIIISCLDNLIKGAAGVAVQNFNLMCGFPETTGLLI